MAAPAVTHTKTLIAPDSGAEDKLYGSDYVSATSHAIADFSGVSKLLGSGSAAATANEISLGAGLTMTGTTLSASGSVTLDGILAASADQAGIANADWNIRWNWQKTTNTEVGFTFGESAASTGGTSTSNIPNQVILKAATVAASTASPFLVESRGSFVAAASPTTAQWIVANGAVGNPGLCFSNSLNTGFYSTGSTSIGVALNSAQNVQFSSSAANGHVRIGSSNGAFTALSAVPALLNVSNAVTTNWGARISYHSSTETLGHLALLRSRGTATSPTVITTGDDLGVITAAGYVGATNDYQIAGSIVCDSTGTISDSATGIAGIWRFMAAKTGAEPTDIFQVNGTEQHTLHQGTAPTITAGGGTNPTIVGRDEACIVTIGTGGVATTVTVTYNTAFTNAPAVVANSDTDIVGFSVAGTTATVTVTAAAPFTAGSKISIISRGYL